MNFHRLVTRRIFLRATAGGASAAAYAFGIASAPGAVVKRTRPAVSSLIDVNLHLSRWPLRRLRFDETAALVGHLRSHGVRQGWTGNFDALLHKDVSAVNSRLADECRRHGRGMLVPIGSINPTLPDWEEDARRCIEEHRMPAIRLHPNYHGYGLNDPECLKLLRFAAAKKLVVQIALMMEDERMMHPRLRVAPVDSAPLPEIVRQTPGLRLVLLNALGTLRGATLKAIVSAGEVYVEIATLEGVGGVGNILGQIPVERLLFGSHAPLFYFESALLKLQESVLDAAQLKAIRQGNAERLLAKERRG